MEIVFLFAKAVLIGFAVAAPVGAIGALCIRHALNGKWFHGLSTGLGAAAADATLAAGAAFGLGLLQPLLLKHVWALQLFGGAFLLFFGGRMILMTTPQLPPRERHRPHRRFHINVKELADYATAFATGFLLTLVNPAAILAFLGIFAGMRVLERYQLGLETAAAMAKSIVLIGGVLLGAMLWWLLLATASAMARERMSHRLVDGINKALGTVVAGFGAFTLFELL